MDPIRLGWLGGAREPWQQRTLDLLRLEPGVETVSLPSEASMSPSNPLGLEVVLVFGDSPDEIPASILPNLPLGVWSLELDPRLVDVGRALDDEPTIGAALVRRWCDRDRILRDTLVDGEFLVRRHSWSKTRRRVLEQVQTWPALAIRRLRTNGHRTGGLVAALPREVGSGGSLPVGSAGAGQLWQLRRRELSGLWRRVGQEFVEQDWNVGVIASSIEHWLGPHLAEAAHREDGGIASILPPQSTRWLPRQGRNLSLADPFVLIHDGRSVVLVESLSHQHGRGVIAAVSGIDEPAVSVSRTVLRSWSHLSYPYCFEHEGTVWCVPEMHEAGRVMLLRADRFPDRWIEDSVLLEGVPVVDPTLFQHEGSWWMLCGRSDWDDWTHLFAWSAPSLHGPWTPHPWNPLRSDVRSTRPAGRPFRIGDRLYRPTQDCSQTYGGAISINEIVELTATSYREVPRLRIVPDPKGPYPDGVHTINSAGSITVIDGKRHFVTSRRLWLQLWRQPQRPQARTAMFDLGPDLDRIGSGVGG
ncbi:MAG: hypothetical protein R3E12_15275 [Candidatus Eisenbacteria bacterium]|uniref:Glucosamine inositolphosphorylceramide transferase 1 N-terminal domain-containing protein n=1 Tax=Eiseniibacteriota bacterium TaxID=2212470 RepID=A0A956LYC7_UNCEI|nr:hypothetical protein [Candidatus Eisenbacteria bacterium]